MGDTWEPLPGLVASQLKVLPILGFCTCCKRPWCTTCGGCDCKGALCIHPQPDTPE